MFKYFLKKTLRNRMFIFWSLCFPLALMALFTAAFSGIYDIENRVDTKKVAVISESDTPFASNFDEVIENVDVLDGVEVKDMKDAEVLLESGEITGLYVVNNKDIDIVMTPDYSEADASILKTVADFYMREYSLIEDAARNGDMTGIQTVIDSLSEELDVVSPVNSAYNETTNPYVWYYFSTLVMGILFQAMAGINLVSDLQADISRSAMRTSVSPTKKIKIVMAGLLSRYLVSLSVSAVALLAMRFVFHIPLGKRILPIILFVLLSNLFSLSLGQICGLFFKGNMTTRGNKTTGLIMVSVFLSGEMIATLPGMFERYFPLLNDINPATVLNLCMYRLVYYQDLTTFYIEMAKILTLTVIFLAISTIKLRRQKYASV